MNDENLCNCTNLLHSEFITNIGNFTQQFPPDYGTKYIPLGVLRTGNVTFGVGPEIAGLCFPGTLSRLKAEGGVVLCDNCRGSRYYNGVFIF